MNDIVAKIIIKVYLVSGREVIHIYEPPTSDKELQEFLTDKLSRTQVLRQDSVSCLYFENPNITYNTSNVEGIEFSHIGVNELESVFKKEQSKIGFT